MSIQLDPGKAVNYTWIENMRLSKKTEIEEEKVKEIKLERDDKES